MLFQRQSLGETLGKSFSRLPGRARRDTASRRLRLEPLEQRTLLATIAGPATVVTSDPYTLQLFSDDDSISSWTIDWGDGSAPETVTGSPPTVSHLYTEDPSTLQIAATAQTGAGPVTASVSGGGEFIDTFVTTEMFDSIGFYRPYGLTFGPDDRLYVVDATQGSNVVLIRSDGTMEGTEEFVTFGIGGLVESANLAFGPDGNLYVSNAEDNVLRFDATTGDPLPGEFGALGTAEFISGGAGGLNRPIDILFGPDATGDTYADLYVGSWATGNPGDEEGEVLLFDGLTGEFIRIFASGGGLEIPQGMEFGPDGDLYVGAQRQQTVLRYDGTTGDYKGVFVSGDELDGSYLGLTFAPDGNILYVTNGVSDEVLRYNGRTSDFIDAFIPRGSGGISYPRFMEFGPDGNVYVSSDAGWDSEVLRYQGPSTSQQTLPVTVGNVLDPFESTDVPKNIRDMKTTTSTLTVPDSVEIFDIDVQLDITHGMDADLNVSLIAPDGTGVWLFHDVGGDGNNFSGTIFDDEAASSINAGTAPFTGSFRPESRLSGFDGKDAQGIWTLEIFDDTRGSRGTLNSWSIEIATLDPPPANQPPDAVNDSKQTAVDTPVTIDVLANDTDPENDPLAVTAVTQAAYGSVVINPDDTVGYTPNGGFTGQDTFTYTVSDGNGGTDRAVVTVDVMASQPVTYSINDVSKREGRTGRTTAFNFTVTRSGATLDLATIYYATALDLLGSHPAEANDFVSIPVTSLEFGDQVTTATISVSVIGDRDPEYAETFLLNLFADPAGAVVLDTATGTILNDDKGTPVESASATDAAFAAWVDPAFSGDDDSEILPQTLADELALMMLE